MGRCRRKKPPDLLEILRRIDADRVVRRFDRLDPYAVLQGAQLLELFGALERRRLERRQDQQSASTIGVQTDVSIERRPSASRVSRMRNGRAREIQRESSAVEH